MTSIKVAILGFGTVGEGVYRTIYTHQKELAAKLGKPVEVAGILIRDEGKQRGIDASVIVTNDFEDILAIDGLDVVIEAIVGCDPAYGYLKRSIEKGCHVITANKEMFAFHGSELQRLAEKHHVSVGFEATVAGGVPIIQTIEQFMSVNRIKKIEGILNGTSNFILSEMRTKGLPFGEALLSAQEKGYAEADPTNDVEGFDAFYKLLILSGIAFGKQPEWNSVEREGISGITSEQITEAEKLGLRFKLIASIQRNGEKISGSVRPTLVSDSHPLFNIEGADNSVSVEGDIVGRVTLQGPGAGMLPTASAVIEELVHVVRGTRKKPASVSLGEEQIREEDDRPGQHWLVMNAKPFTESSGCLTADGQQVPYLVAADQLGITKFKKNTGQKEVFEVLGDLKKAKISLGRQPVQG